MTVKLEIVTPSSVAWAGEAAEVQAPGLFGEFGVLDGHAALLAATRVGVVTVHTQGGTSRMVVGAGFAEVGGGEMTLLVDSFEKGEAVDKSAAATALAEAESVLGAADPTTPEFLAAERKASLARARLDV